MNFSRVFVFEDSSMISEIRYDPESRSALVTFKNNGAVYLIEDLLPLDLAAMVVAPSVGRAYHRIVPDNYNPVRYHDPEEQRTRS